ncbi:MAG: adenylate/guanylate cyclase domain-containing protein [Acidimicrobiia bacterium]
MAAETDVVRSPRQLPPAVERFLSIAVLDGDDAGTVRSKRLLTGALAVSGLTSALSAYAQAGFSAPLASLAIALTAVVSIASLVAMWRRPRTYPAVMHYVTATSLAVSGAVTIMYGGIIESGAAPVWGVITILGALVIFADRRATFWMVTFVLTTLASVWVADRVDPIYRLDDPASLVVFNLLVVMVFVYAALYFYVRISANLQRQSDALLRNILPDEIAARLKASSQMIADDFESASILFADVAGFTPMSSEMSSAELIGLLDEVFTIFDELVQARGLEKIKTIGDAYMAAAGVPVARDDHALAICDLALAMQETVAGRSFMGRRLRFRIGISSGPVTAGIIGRSKFSYDLWGDTVNTASRMESSGDPERIQMTEDTHSLVQDDYVCEPKGTVDVKGKGPMVVWYLVGRRRLKVPPRSP